MINDAQQDLVKSIDLGSSLRNLAEVLLHRLFGQLKLIILMLDLLKLILE